MKHEKIKELQRAWKKIEKHVFDENTEKKMNEFCILVEDTYNLFYNFVVAEEIPDEVMGILPLIRKVARIPETSGEFAINEYTVISEALSNWIKFYSLDNTYKEFKKGILKYKAKHLLKKTYYSYNVESKDLSDIQKMFDEMNAKEFLVWKEDSNATEWILTKMLDDEHGEFEWKSFTDIARQIAYNLDWHDNDAPEGYMLKDSTHIAMKLYAYSQKEPHFQYKEDAYGFRASQLIAYTLSQIAVGNFSHQKNYKYDPDNLVVYDKDDIIIGKIDTHTFNVSEEFIRYADFYDCVNPNNCKIDSIEVKNSSVLADDDVISTEFYPYDNCLSGKYKITIKSNGEIGDFGGEAWWGPQFTYQIKDDILYLGLYYDCNFAFAFTPKTFNDINKIYLTNGRIDRLIWEK